MRISYLTSDKLILEEKQLLFQFRTQTYNCKSNFRKRYEPDLSCFVCKAEDTQQHLLTCNVADDVDTENIEYEDIFKSVENQVKLAKIFKENSLKENPAVEEIFHHWKPGALLECLV